MKERREMKKRNNCSDVFEQSCDERFSHDIDKRKRLSGLSRYIVRLGLVLVFQGVYPSKVSVRPSML